MNIRELTRYWGDVIHTVRLVGQTIPGAGNGNVKRELVHNLLVLADDEIPKIWPIIERMITIIVAGFNASGVFAKSSGDS